jgi:Domain of unknown function (DUF5658)
MTRVACVWVFVCSLAAGQAKAQDLAAAPAVTFAVTPSIEQVAATPPSPVFRAAAKRPSPLVPMYVSFAALEGLDYTSTTKALASGAGREANPVMGAIVGNRAAFFAVKAGTAAATIWMAERMWKKHPVRAVIVMGVLNGAMGTVVAHNMRVR